MTYGLISIFVQLLLKPLAAALFALESSSLAQLSTNPSQSPLLPSSEVEYLLKYIYSYFACSLFLQLLK